jgi:hypothetical protein
MASGLSSPADTSTLSSILGFTSGFLAVPTALAISLHTAAIGTAKVLASEWTQTNTNYTRLSIGVGTANWALAAFSAGTGVVATNKVQVAFAAASGSAFPLNLVAVGFSDSATYNSGNFLFFSDVTSQAVPSGIICQFNIGDVSFTLL